MQTNNRAELAAIEASLQLAWNSDHADCRIMTDCNMACQAIDNVTPEWEWRRALDVQMGVKRLALGNGQPSKSRGLMATYSEMVEVF